MMQWLLDWFREDGDPIVDALIAEKGCQERYRPGMEHPDMDIINKIGLRTWTNVLQAQRRLKSNRQGPEV